MQSKVKEDYQGNKYMEHFGLFGIFVIGFVGALTPGPDILLVLRTSLCLGMRVAFVAFLGIASGWVVFMGALYLGLSYVLGNVFVQIALMFVVGVYLAYLAYVLLANVDYEGVITQINQRPQDKDFRALLGLYFKALGINLSNPKALLFFATIIVPFMEVDLRERIMVLFCALSLPFLGVIVLGNVLRAYLTQKMFMWIDRLCGVLFAFFSAYLFYAIWHILYS